jgi:hypothetical protein
MKTKIVIGILVVMLGFPAASHSFGLLRYVFDGIANEFGLDRGPIPKAIPKAPPPGYNSSDPAAIRHPDAHRIYIQAEGF